MLNKDFMMVKASVKVKKLADGSDDVNIVEMISKRHIGTRLDNVKDRIEAACLLKAETIMPTKNEA